MLFDEFLSLILRGKRHGLIAHHAVDVVAVNINSLRRINKRGIVRLFPTGLTHVMDEKTDQATRVFRLQRKGKGIAAGTELHGFAIGSFDEDLSLGAGIVHALR